MRKTRIDAQTASIVSATANLEAEAMPGIRLHAEASIWTDRMVSALVNGVKGGKWYSLIDKVVRPSTLELAWHRVARNKGAAGVDGQSIAKFEAHADRYLQELHEDLRTGRYRPDPIKRVEIPKGDGRMRPLGIPTVKDRIVQTALKMVIEPIFEVTFLPGSYGFRPGRGCHDALREVTGLIAAGYTHVVDADLQSYFDTIPHALLLAEVERSIGDGAVLDLIERFLMQDVMKGLTRWQPPRGTPQGAVISPLLANIFLHPLDRLMAERGFRMVRYADDFVILCRSAEEAQSALHGVQTWVSAHGLTLHPDKTRVGDCSVRGQGFDFLGYRFECGLRLVRKKSMAALRDKLRAKTRRGRGDSLAKIIEDLNPLLRGWFGYFKFVFPSELTGVDGFVRRRLRAILRKQEKRPGFGKCLNDSLKWRNAFFAEQGLFTLATALAAARHSR